MRRPSLYVTRLVAAVIAALAIQTIFPPGGLAAAPDPPRVRKPVVAGLFYPANPQELRDTVEASLKSTARQQISGPIKAIMAPHAGYVYCGKTMAAAFKQIETPDFRYHTVILMGPSHRAPTKAAAVSSADFWDTPLGRVQVDTAMAKELTRRSDRIEFDDRAHVQEHCLEVQLPYLMAAAGGKPFKIVPLVTSSPEPTVHDIVARALADVASDPGCLIVLSTDLSHYPAAKDAQKADSQILDAMQTLRPETVMDANTNILKSRYPGMSVTMCGIEAALCLLRCGPSIGLAQARQLGYTHSGMSGGDNSKVVGYGAMVFLAGDKAATPAKPEPLVLSFSEASRKELLAVARSAAKAALEGAWVSYDPSNNPELQVRAGCFVTFKNKGRLRGCIGAFSSEAPLWKTVREVAIASATKDVRFAADPITARELNELEIEISVLSPMRLVTKPLQEIKLGRDGIVIKDKGRSGTFLPQVAEETGWSLEEFLGHCSRDKAGLGWDGWKSPSAQVSAYSATILKE